jgi:hypothetical protein
MENEMILIGEVTYVAGMGEDHRAFVADESDPEEFAEAMVRGGVLWLTIEGATHLIPSTMIRRVYFSKGWPDPKRYPKAKLKFYYR